jgi:3-hydroxy-5-methyl-1-naphthoate 3-O-methyltransferase
MPTPPFDFELLTLPPELPPDMRSVWSMAVMHAQFKTLCLALELGVVTRLAGAPATVAELGAALGMTARPAAALAGTLVTLGVIESVDGRLQPTALGRDYFVEGRVSYVGPYLRRYERLFAGMDQLRETFFQDRPLGETGLGRLDREMGEWEDARVADFQRGMMAMSYEGAAYLAERYAFDGARHLLDVGGGLGHYAIMAALRHPHLTATLFDLPRVCALAEPFIARHGLAERVRVHPGSFFDDALPTGADTLLLGNVLHDWDDPAALAILRRCRAALPAGGTLLLVESLLADDGAGPPHAAAASLAMLLRNPGRNRSEAEYRRMLESAGFGEVAVRALCSQDLVVARAG